MNSPQPVTWYKWLIAVFFGCSWALPAIFAIPLMQRSSVSLALAEILWSVMWVALTVHALSWFRVELNDRGVVEHGIFNVSYIPWSEATMKRVGYRFVVSSGKGSIRINPFVYRNPKELDEFLTAHLPRS
jgi:hypothetical protein